MNKQPPGSEAANDVCGSVHHDRPLLPSQSYGKCLKIREATGHREGEGGQPHVAQQGTEVERLL